MRFPFSLLLLTMAFAPTVAFAQSGIPPSVSTYHEIADALQKDRISFHEAYAKGARAAQDLRDAFDSMTDQDFKVAQELMTGFRIERRPTAAISPDPAFFLSQARIRGNAEDVAYFELAQQTRIAESGPCNHFNGTLTSLHRKWTGFRDRFSEAYLGESWDALLGIESAFLNAHCACETKPEVTREFKAYLALKPEAANARQVKARLRKLDLKFSCKR